jgi:enoyl-CoA hydratase/carnithine racemase
MVEITLDRPEHRNALSRTLLGQLCEELARAQADATGALVLRGAQGCFCAGADLDELSGTAADVAVDDAIEAAVRAVRETPVPVVAAIEGACIGAGLDLALACDLRVAGASAFFELPATRLGLLYSPSAVARMHAVLGACVLDRLLLVGERLDAEAALGAGLVSHRAAAGDARRVAADLALRACGNVAPAVAASKALLRALDDGDFDPQTWAARRAQILDSPERGEALARARTGRAGS